MIQAPIYTEAVRTDARLCRPDGRARRSLVKTAGFADLRRHEQMFAADPYVREGDVTFFVPTTARPA